MTNRIIAVVERLIASSTPPPHELPAEIPVPSPGTSLPHQAGGDTLPHPKVDCSMPNMQAPRLLHRIPHHPMCTVAHPPRCLILIWTRPLWAQRFLAQDPPPPFLRQGMGGNPTSIIDRCLEVLKDMPTPVLVRLRGKRRDLRELVVGCFSFRVMTGMTRMMRSHAGIIPRLFFVPQVFLEEIGIILVQSLQGGGNVIGML